MSKLKELPKVFLQKLSADRVLPVTQLRTVFLLHLPEGFEEHTDEGFIHFVVPKTLYPPGYHCNPKQPLPFVSIASQKNFIALYHMGIYAFPEILEWFQNEYARRVSSKLDMGKSCIRFKKTQDIPLQLLEELATKITPAMWIQRYEEVIKK